LLKIKDNLVCKLHNFKFSILKVKKLLKVNQHLPHQTILGMVVLQLKLMMETLNLKIKEKYIIKNKVKIIFYVVILINIGKLI